MFMMGGPNSDALNHNAAVGWDRTISPTVLNEARVGFNRFDVVATGPTPTEWTQNNILGIPNGNIPGLPYTSGIAQFNISGLYR